MLHTDYSGIKRGLKRKINQAKRDGDEVLLLNIDFADNILKALDDLAFYYRTHKKAEGGE